VLISHCPQMRTNLPDGGLTVTSGCLTTGCATPDGAAPMSDPGGMMIVTPREPGPVVYVVGRGRAAEGAA
jgi:hypothetical protein